LFFETGGKAVALFDYVFAMRKADDSVVTPDGTTQSQMGDGSAEAA